MAKGGFTGAVPPRETSPEEYSGVWDITEQYGEQKAGSWPFQADDNAPKSLRFDGSSSYLSKTPTQAGNKRTWTFSFWVKRCNVGSATQVILMAYNGAIDEANYATISFTSTGQLRVGWAYDTYKTTTAQYRDPSAWMHCCVSVDTNHAVASERVQIAINGVKLTEFAGSHDPDLGQQLAWNGAYLHHLGSEASQQYSHNYLSEIQFVDGQQLSCEEFGFFDGQGIWQPKRFTGDYSSGPDWNNFISGSTYNSTHSLDKTFDGLNNTYSAAAGGGTITFAPVPAITGITKVKLRVFRDSSTTTDITLNGNVITSSFTAGQYTDAEFTVNNLTELKWTTDSSNQWIGVAQIFVERGGVYELLTPPAVGRNSFHLDFSDGVKDQSGLGNDWTPNNITLRGDGTIYSNSLTSSAAFSANNPASYGFDGSIAGPNVPYVGGSDAAIVWTPPGGYDYSEKVEVYVGGVSGFRWNLNGGGWNTTTVNSWNTVATGSGTITTLSVDRNGSATHGWHAIKIDNQILIDGQYPDFFVDSPVNGNEASTGAGGERRGNYASLNPLQKYSAIALSEGNLAFTDDNTSNGGDQGVHATIMPTSGKFYWEMEFSLLASENYVGLSKHDKLTQTIWTGGAPDGYYYYNNGNKIGGGNGNGGVAYGASFAANDVIGIAADWDNGKITFYKNGSSQGDAFTGVDLTGYIPAFYFNTNQSSTGKINFGQRPYKYQNAGVNRPSADYKPLATSFLPEPTIKRGDEAMDVALWTGNNSIQQISGFKFSPDLVWIKNRDSGSYGHRIVDSVRGATYRLQSHTNAAQGQETTGLTAFNDDGFTLGAAQDYNLSANNHVGWMWDAGEATTTIAAGGSNSSAYNQSQTWSSNITTTGNSGSWWPTYPATNAFNSNDANYAHANGDGSQTAVVTLTLNPGVSCSNTVTFLGGMTGSGTATISVNGGTAVSLTSGSSATTKTNVSFSGTVTSIVITKTSSDASGMLIYGFEIDGTRLVDNGVSVTNVPEVECKVRANQAAGFSIVKVDSPTATETRVHGLSKAPEFFICKSTASADSWHTYWKELGKDYYINIYPIGAKASSDQFGSQEPNSVSFYVKANTGSGANKSGGMIYYLWHSVEGFSKFSSYEGTGGDVFVYCGFRPRLITFKNADQSNSWLTYDTARDPSNVANRSIQWDNSYNDSGITNDDIDILSNGFVIKNTRNDMTANGLKILFGAWAEHPFASNSRAR